MIFNGLDLPIADASVPLWDIVSWLNEDCSEPLHEQWECVAEEHVYSSLLTSESTAPSSFIT